MRIFCPKHDQNILIDIHYETIYEPVRTECSFYTVVTVIIVLGGLAVMMLNQIVR